MAGREKLRTILPRSGFDAVAHPSRVCWTCRVDRPAQSAFSCYQRRRYTSTTRQMTATSDMDELENSSFSAPTKDQSIDPFEPAAQARARERQLPSSRYKFKPPKYDRGPFHPHQPPKPSDPASREFIPGPFTTPRLEETYNSTIASDLMTLQYTHFPYGYEEPERSGRLRTWDDSSPYHKGRGLRAPRGAKTLRPIRRPMTFRNITKITGVTVHAFVQGATEDSAHLHVAGMAIQAITGVRCQVHFAKKSVTQWGLKKGKAVAVTANLEREDMYHFLSKCVEVVMPRIRDYRGVRGSAGDSVGNITFGFVPDQVALFPEIEVNYDSYPPKMIPGCHITIKTNATNDRDARMLLSAIGIPFYGKYVN